jgi:probable HAF family extracellular repeat protein
MRETHGPQAGVRYTVQPLDRQLAVGHGLNDAGDVAGESTQASRRAIVLRDGVVTELGTLGGAFSTARGINNAGHVVGGSLTDGDRDHHAFLYVDGAMHDLNELIEPGWEIVHALSINDAGDILAIANRGDGDWPVLLVRVNTHRV